MDRDSRPLIAPFHEVMAAAHASHAKAKLLEQFDHLLPGDARQLTHGSAGLSPS